MTAEDKKELLVDTACALARAKDEIIYAMNKAPTERLKRRIETIGQRIEILQHDKQLRGRV